MDLLPWSYVDRGFLYQLAQVCPHNVLYFLVDKRLLERNSLAIEVRAYFQSGKDQRNCEISDRETTYEQHYNM